MTCTILNNAVVVHEVGEGLHALGVFLHVELLLFREVLLLQGSPYLRPNIPPLTAGRVATAWAGAGLAATFAVGAGRVTALEFLTLADPTLLVVAAGLDARLFGRGRDILPVACRIAIRSRISDP